MLLYEDNQQHLPHLAKRILYADEPPRLQEFIKLLVSLGFLRPRHLLKSERYYIEEFGIWNEGFQVASEVLLLILSCVVPCDEAELQVRFGLAFKRK